nr:hypothetical protein Iba_chr14aCG6940 [Ipomoea batatas]
MAESQANFPQARSNTLTSKEKDTEGASVQGYDKGEKAPRRHVGLRCSGGNPHARTGPAKASGACGFALLGGNPPARIGPARQGRRSILWLLRRAGRVGLRCLEATHMHTGPARQGRRSVRWLLRRAGRVGLRCLEATHMRRTCRAE